jgi:tRNA modification GTPase
VALGGRPNAGKSSLLNVLLGEERAIVTDIPGTTRDTIRETIAIDGVHYHLVDTAGLRDTADHVESLGVERTRAALETCDVALLVVAATDRGGPSELLSVVEGRPCGILANKVDLARPEWPEVGVPVLHVSATRGDGLNEIEGFLEGLARRAGLGPSTETVLLTRERHRRTLEAAAADLDRAKDAALGELGHELVAVDLRSALDHVGALTGAITDDDILNRIFGDFCVGK